MTSKDLKNYSEWRNIKAAIKEALPNYDLSNLKPYLWKNEINDVFFLTKCMEIYLYNRKILRCHCWSRKAPLQLKKSSIIYNDFFTSDGLYVFDSDLKNLPLLLSLGGGFKRRPNICGKWVGSRKKKLGHEIHPFCPVLFTDHDSKPVQTSDLLGVILEQECETLVN